jgi:hypothetical protein
MNVAFPFISVRLLAGIWGISIEIFEISPEWFLNLLFCFCHYIL